MFCLVMMVSIMKANGGIIKLKEMVQDGLLMEIYIEDNLKRIG